MYMIYVEKREGREKKDRNAMEDSLEFLYSVFAYVVVLLSRTIKQYSYAYNFLILIQ